MSDKYRTNTCGDLTTKDEGKEVKLAAWVKSRRDHGGVIFLDLRDRYGVTQVTFHPENKEVFAEADKARPEDVVEISGRVAPRPAGMVNDKLATGEIEVAADSFKFLSRSQTPPFELKQAEKVDEELRLKYRYIDLRREKMKRNLIFRHQAINYIRQFMTKEGFVEVETPILTSSSPEGARDFLVPSRLHPGKFYALPQAPQQFKQLLMVGGMDKYFQIAPCMRDEDARADRSPGEFYQLDMEMSFVEQEDVWGVIEPLMIELTEKVAGKKVLTKPFPKMTYAEAMSKYGSDRPDLRFAMEFHEVTDWGRKSDFMVFQETPIIKGIKVDGGGKFSRSEIDGVVEKARELGARGLAWVKVVSGGKLESQIAKFFNDDLRKELIAEFEAAEGDLIALVADEEAVVNSVLGQLRVHLAEKLGLLDDNVLAWAWITDFPMFEISEETGQVDFGHNPFSMPQGGMEALETKDPLDILAYQYDIICNGYEVSSGAIRNHDPKILQRAFELVGYPPAEFKKRFGHMAKAFQYGVPPHGGIAPGIERILMLLLGEKNIREVVAFPKNQQAEDLMMGAPSEVPEKDLRAVHIKVVKDED